MILYSKLTKLEDRKIEIHFYIKNNNPENVKIEWLDTDYNSEIFKLLKKNNNEFIVTFNSKSEKILVTVDNEPGKIFETNSSEFDTNDIPLYYTKSSYNTYRMYLPFCDNNIKIDILTDNGQTLEYNSRSGEQVVYSNLGVSFNNNSTLRYEKCKLNSFFYVEIKYVKVLEQWQDIDNIGKYYIRVSNVQKPITFSGIIEGTENLINDKLYGKTYGTWVG